LLRIVKNNLLCWILLLGTFSWSWGEEPTHVRLAFSQASFPDVALQDVRTALAIWGAEVTRNIKGVDKLSTEIYPTLDGLVAAIRNGSIDLAILPSVDYFKVERQLDMELGFITDQGLSGNQRYLVVTQASLAGVPLQELRGRRFSYMNRDQLGLLYFNGLLLKGGQPEMDRFFSSTEALAKGSQVLNSLYFGKADICLVTEDSYRTTVAMNPQIAKKVRILFTSPDLHIGLAVYRKGYPGYLRRRIEAAVNNLRNYPRGAQILSLFQTTHIRPATEADLASTRKIYKEYRQMKGRLL